MPQKKLKQLPSLSKLLEPLRPRLRGSIGIVMGSPREAADLVGATEAADVLCYQMDLHQATRLREELAGRNLQAEVVTLPDLWDVPRPLQTLLYPVPLKGERILKIDLIEQAFHALAPGGNFIVLSPHGGNSALAPQLRKIFGSVHVPPKTVNTAVWCKRVGDRPRRRHEVKYHVRVDKSVSLEFLSRPGVFSYGQFDDGARALTEVMEIDPGDRIVDLGCGDGANGVIASRRNGAKGFTTFVDSNVRAIALAEINARHNGVERFETVATPTMSGMKEGSFDVVLANPPYYAQLTIAGRFIERGHALLKMGGRFFLVTKMLNELHPIIENTFGATEVYENRGYFVFFAEKMK